MPHNEVLHARSYARAVLVQESRPAANSTFLLRSPFHLFSACGISIKLPYHSISRCTTPRTLSSTAQFFLEPTRTREAAAPLPDEGPRPPPPPRVTPSTPSVTEFPRTKVVEHSTEGPSVSKSRHCGSSPMLRRNPDKLQPLHQLTSKFFRPMHCNPMATMRRLCLR
ncbi:hypothetical protein K458DRAFT_143412 [Lentithecium fluviatile CBS 122367]|uniref:Uncharacterized protein n=1 Tax=Lentithecium fluviatile CBS 122367 TaxID=1168545 RepID=A0A6G1IIH4_9PLEO|nr:hypothetical protein K458DRAFT_143412 [Lentithecium fluviatile CBS 122367]